VLPEAVTVMTTAYITFALFVRLTRTVHAEPPAGRPEPRNHALQSPGSVAVSTARPPVTTGTSTFAPAGLIFTDVALSAFALTNVNTRIPATLADGVIEMSNEACEADPAVPVCDSTAVSWATAI
jgi:hypothetical protein